MTVLVISLGAVSVPALAEAGKILFVRGEVTIVEDGGDRSTADAGTVVEEGDRIRTGGDSRAQLRLSDGALISLRSHSDYQIVAQKQEEGLLEQAGKLFSGWMRSVSGAIAKARPEAVEQETPVATIGIRGTTYQVIHMPEGGIPGMPESEPGTYIYLQQGRIESIAGGETRFMEPGDVVYVPMDGGAPVPAPDKKALFSRGGGQTVQTRSGELQETPGGEEPGDREDLESTDSLNDTLEGRIDAPVDTPNLVATGFSFATGTGYGSPAKIFATSPEVTMRDEGSDRVVDTLTFTEQVDGGIYELNSLAGEVPSIDIGTHTLPDAESTRIDWGVWDSSQYTLTVDGTAVTQANRNDWHYMVADNHMDLDTLTDRVNSGGIAGAFDYNFVGGTLSGNGSITGGTITVDFGALGTAQDSMYVTLNTSFGGFGGYGTIQNFYNGGVNISGTAPGRIEGTFVGESAGGIISNVELDEQTVGTHYGTAAFEQGASVSGIPN